jgi:hypothetical protein
MMWLTIQAVRAAPLGVVQLRFLIVAMAVSRNI